MFSFKPKKIIAIGAIFRNEKEYILEWISWHQSQGISKFYICDNYSDDGTYELLQSLQEKGVIELFQIERQPKAQILAYNEIMRRAREQVDLIGFVDADEFLVPEGRAKVSKHLTQLFEDETVGAVGINWRIYGTSGIKAFNEGFVIERFQMAASDNQPRNHYIKSFYRPEAIRKVFCHIGSFVDDFRYINTSGDNIEFATFKGQLRRAEGDAKTGVSWQVSDKRIRLNHYALKSESEFILKKQKRGDAIYGQEHGRRAGYFKAFDLNDVHMPITPRHYKQFLKAHKKLVSQL